MQRLVVVAWCMSMSISVARADDATVPPKKGIATTSSLKEYRDAANRILAAGQNDDGAYTNLAYLTDHIGNRISGSHQLELAVTWAVKAMIAGGLENVHTEEVMVPHWVRGAEQASLVSPIERPLVMMGIGNSVGTGKKAITAEVVVVKDFDELTKVGQGVKGKIVLFNFPMAYYTDVKGSGYGDAVAYRTAGASRAALLGAKAVLVRSVTTVSLRSPHTGAVHYEDNAPKIPAAAVSIEDAELIARLAAGGETVKVKLSMAAKMLPDAKSANVIGDLVGREKPEEIVLIGGHLDSWDVGQGAHDDGAGIVTMLQAAALLKKLGLQPRRTIRVVFFTNEENGLRGAKAYAEGHAAEAKNHVLAIEADSGGFSPRGFSVEGTEAALTDTRDIVGLLGAIGANEWSRDGGGSDVGPLAKAGVPVMSLWVDGRHYFDFHHSQADTLDKVDSRQLARCAAAVAVMAYVAAEMPRRFGSGTGVLSPTAPNAPKANPAKPANK